MAASSRIGREPLRQEKFRWQAGRQCFLMTAPIIAPFNLDDYMQKTCKVPAIERFYSSRAACISCRIIPAAKAGSAAAEIGRPTTR